MKRLLCIAVLCAATASLLAVAACGSFTSSDPVPDEGGNDVPSDGAVQPSSFDAGPPDASSFSCASHPAAFFCADFDEQRPIAFVSGNPISLPDLMDGSALTQPFVSAPAALWTPHTDRISGTGNTAVTSIHATFLIRFDTIESGSVTYARLEITPSCAVSFQQQTGPDRLGIKTDCAFGGGNAFMEQGTLQQLPATGFWSEVELTADFANHIATGRFGHGTAVTAMLNPTAADGGLPKVTFGPDVQLNRVGLENILVDVK